MEVLEVIIWAFIIFCGFGILHDLSKNERVGWGKILLGILFIVFLMAIAF